MNNVLIIIGDFNIRNNDWDPLYPYHSTYVDMLWEVANSLNLELSISINSILTWYADNP